MNETFPFVTAWLDPGGVKLGEGSQTRTAEGDAKLSWGRMKCWSGCCTDSFSCPCRKVSGCTITFNDDNGSNGSEFRAGNIVSVTHPGFQDGEKITVTLPGKTTLPKNQVISQALPRSLL